MDIATTAGKHCVPDRKSSTTDSEATLKNKDILSYELLIAPIEAQMMRSIWRIVRHPEAAEDTMQDALTIIWKKLDRIRKHPNPQAFILKICVNAAYDTLRKSSRINKREEPLDIQEFLSDSGSDNLTRLEQKNVEAEILEAIRRLPRKQALAVLMRIVQEQSYDSIADVLECSEVTVRVHVSKGRAKLIRRLSHLNPISVKETENDSKK